MEPPQGLGTGQFDLPVLRVAAVDLQVLRRNSFGANDLDCHLPVALQVPSPRGDALYWHAGRVFDEQHFPARERVFEEVTLVMVPERALQPASKSTLEQVYGRELELHFQRIDQSRLWVLYGRRDGAASTPDSTE